MSIWELTQFTLNVMPITSNFMFNYFFTLVSFFGLLSLAVSMIVKVISRS
jgi:hypothetical protein